MTFLNLPILFALSAVSVPIVLHLFNRRSARTVDWGAMRFLLGSMVSRKRRVLVEEVLLLALRCLLIALVVLAVARPVLPSGSSIALAVVLPALLLGAVAFGIGTALWQEQRWRWTFYGVGCGLLLLGLAIVLLGDRLQLDQFEGEPRDVAIVLDASSSMNITVDGKTNFARAVEEASAMVNSLGGSSTVSIILAGTGPEIVTPHPLTDHGRINAILDNLKPLGGAMAIHEAMTFASESLVSGSNAAKQIVILTDGQSIGWDVDSRSKWNATATAVKGEHVLAPEIFCRTFDGPREPRNLAVSDVTFGRQVVGTDRALPIQVRLANTGAGRLPSATVELYVDAKKVDQRPLTALEPGTSETISFSHQFDKPVAHVVEIRAEIDDDLPFDNKQTRVVDVRDQLPVLIVDGNPARRFLDRASAFIHLALDPAGALASADSGRATGLVQVSVTEASRMNEVEDLDSYRAIILADVPRLPKREADRMFRFVAAGGGLLVAPGERAMPDFYNTWTAPDGQPGSSIMPAILGQRTTLPSDAEPLKFALTTFSHSALVGFAEADKTDLKSTTCTSYWQLDIDPANKQAQIGGRLTSGQPLLVQQQMGQGKVVVTAISLDIRGGNLPTRRSFLPLLHALVYDLSEGGRGELNHPPGKEVVLRLAADGRFSNLPDSSTQLQVTAPDGSQREATGRLANDSFLIGMRASLPGVYRVALPRSADNQVQNDVPFVVLAQAGESDMEVLSDDDYELLQSVVKLQRLPGQEDLLAVASGRTRGRELWMYLAFCAFFVLLGESFLTRWIAVARKSASSEPIDFTHRGATSSAFDAHVARLKSASQIPTPVPEGEDVNV